MRRCKLSEVVVTILMSEETPSLEMLGWDSQWDSAFASLRERGYQPGRIIIEDKHHYVALTSSGGLVAQVSGKLLHRTPSSGDLPKVGDWVALTPLPNEDKAVIHDVLPRRSKLSRKISGRETEEQVMVTNVDLGFVVQALDRTFNPRLMERHLLMVHEGGAKPVIVLNKADLCDCLEKKVSQARAVAGAAPILIVSAKTGSSIDQLAGFVAPRTTIVFLGVSGVGKSSLINRLYGQEIQAVAEVRERDSKGRHMTTWRELIILPQGGLVIDTPGMREFHLWTGSEGLPEAFSDIEQISVQCHFRNCTHTVEKRCAVLEALTRGEISKQRYDNYLKLKRELNVLEQAQQRRGAIERKRKTKATERLLNRTVKTGEQFL